MADGLSDPPQTGLGRVRKANLPAAPTATFSRLAVKIDLPSIADRINAIFFFRLFFGPDYLPPLALTSPKPPARLAKANAGPGP